VSDLTWLEVRLGQFTPDQQPFRMAFDLSYPNNRYIHASLVKDEVFDWPFATVLTRFLAAGDTFIDIGSHIGYYSLLARRFVGDTGNVYAFEPSPETYSILLSSIQINSYRNITAFNCAISDKEQVVEFSISDIDDGLSSLVDIGGTKISVHSTTLDALHERLKFNQVRVMKIDVEGFETAVIKGGRNFFRDVMPENVAFELNNQIPGVARHQDQPLRAYFASMGYKSYLVRPLICGKATDELFGESLLLEIPVDIFIGGLEYGNILATRRSFDAPVLA
jgi:FkbM family methyltransferase